MAAGYISVGGAPALTAVFRSVAQKSKGLTTRQFNRRGDYSATSITKFAI
ncbi:hypothetical protein [Rhizobium leguminosarum]|nr:hypothetical protein [Rhizobium leguminosarum]MBY5387379.1 hypothetical protein [Rhizobium leguminosarum]MBY5431412.1 hypothetical protein [Rhizobium leguminosarum]NEK41082.1 hypothetical protein [Rhizobium leguminosarum]